MFLYARVRAKLMDLGIWAIFLKKEMFFYSMLEYAQFKCLRSHTRAPLSSDVTQVLTLEISTLSSA